MRRFSSPTQTFKIRVFLRQSPPKHPMLLLKIALFLPAGT
jgi:hypothetical protein